ncbi:DUF397 domain-containing protein [Streptomyces sp. NPDC005774]|uniref:DUF397 domain-containing protein n=1 Tax=Streptomyces sp. NPDC005774 TaxID=3364728 RepID=UPI00367966DC
MNRKGSVAADVEPTWFKSSYSDSSNPSDCVEVAISPGVGTVLVRDSKNTQGPRLTLAPAAWADFLGMAGFASRG